MSDNWNLFLKWWQIKFDVKRNIVGRDEENVFDFLTEKEEIAFSDEDEKADWDEEQKRLDREWYGLDEGYDDDHNPFSGMSEEYKKKKEDELEKKKKQRMTARQRQINRVSC